MDLAKLTPAQRALWLKLYGDRPAHRSGGQTQEQAEAATSRRGWDNNTSN